jgi:DNA polymerase-3 subunit chi
MTVHALRQRTELLDRRVHGALDWAMTEVLFYHLERRPLEAVLPQLLEKTLERGWRAVVEAGSAERVEALSSALWTYRDDAFLPHGTREDGHAARQPIWLTDSDENPNGAQVRFLVDGAAAQGLDGLERAVYLFDGRNTEAVDAARQRWREAAAAGHSVTYWREDESGKWQKMA